MADPPFQTIISLIAIRANGDTVDLAIAFAALKKAMGSADPAVAVVASAAIVAMMRSAESV